MVTNQVLASIENSKKKVIYLLVMTNASPATIARVESIFKKANDEAIVQNFVIPQYARCRTCGMWHPADYPAHTNPQELFWLRFTTQELDGMFGYSGWQAVAGELTFRKELR